jgi:hypothetical protein
MAKQKTIFRHFCKCIERTPPEISHLHKYSDALLSTLLKHSGSDYSLKSSWVWHNKPGTPVFGEFLQFFSADPLKLCQVGWGASLQRCSDRVQVWALAGPLKDIQRLFRKSLLRCLDCVLRVIVLLEGEPSAQSEVLRALEQVFIKDMSLLFSVNLSLDPD